MSQGPVRLGIVGCGAVTELSFAPALESMDIVRVVALVDRDRERAARLARRLDAEIVDTNYESLAGRVDAVVIALPNYLHHPASLFFVRHGVHVLIEKPMATSTRECREIIEEAEKRRVLVAVGHVRRFYYSSRFVKYAIESGLIGDVREFSFKEGGSYNWPTASGFYFDAQKAGGGVLMDIGPHALDLCLWWLGDPVELRYQDDNYGGVEANCVLELTTSSGAVGVVKLSRLVTLDNSFQIIGSKGRIAGTVFEFDQLHLRLDAVGDLDVATPFRTSLGDYFKAELTNFVDAVTKGVPLAVDGRAGTRVVDFIERCYRSRQPLQAPWEIRG